MLPFSILSRKEVIKVDFYIIPLTSDPNQSLRVTIPVDGRNLTLRLTINYNEAAGYWTMSIMDDLTDKVLVTSIPLYSGKYPAANLLEQYSYLRIGSAWLVKVNQDTKSDYPNDMNLGTDFLLMWGDTVE